MMQIMWYWYVLSVVGAFAIGVVGTIYFFTQEAIEDDS